MPGQVPEWARKSANTLSYVTVELRYLCIMWSGCTGYRQIIGRSRCCQYLGYPNQPDWKYNGINEIQPEHCRIEKMRFHNESGWKPLGQHNPALSRPNLNLTCGPSSQGPHARLRLPNWVGWAKTWQEKESSSSPHPSSSKKEKRSELLLAVAASSFLFRIRFQ